MVTLYGMITPGERLTEASRCVFVIDDRQVLRASIYDPLTNGRNTQEIIRLVKALQTADEHEVASPRPGRPGNL